MKNLAVIYHSAHGNTAQIAQFIAQGAAGATGVRTELLRAEDLACAPERLSDTCLSPQGRSMVRRPEISCPP